MNKHSSKSQIAKKSVLRNLALSIFAVFALAGAAYAQQAGTDAMLKAKDDADSRAAKDYINRMQTDEQYQKAIREQPSATTSNDPWGSVRPATPANSAAKPAVKSATKTASGTGKPAGAVKPAPSANGGTPKGQQ